MKIVTAEALRHRENEQGFLKLPGFLCASVSLW
jgi:hypothetical protein